MPLQPPPQTLTQLNVTASQSEGLVLGGTAVDAWGGNDGAPTAPRAPPRPPVLERTRSCASAMHQRAAKLLNGTLEAGSLQQHSSGRRRHSPRSPNRALSQWISLRVLPEPPPAHHAVTDPL